MTNVTRCKVRVHSVQESSGGVMVQIGSPQYDPNPESENGRFFQSTPGINISLGIVNKAAAANLIPGQDYYMDLIPVELEQA